MEFLELRVQRYSRASWNLLAFSFMSLRLFEGFLDLHGLELYDFKAI